MTLSEIEITEIPPLKPSEQSLLNVFNVLHGELTLIGLTKAFFATKQFGGRFCIASNVGVGTRVRIHVPRPAAAQTR